MLVLLLWLMDELRGHGGGLCVHVLPVFSASFPVALVVEPMCVYHNREITAENRESSSGSETHSPHPLLTPWERTDTLSRLTRARVH